MDGMFGDSQEDEDAAEDEQQFFEYVQNEVLEVKILDMTKASGLYEKKILCFFVRLHHQRHKPGNNRNKAFRDMKDYQCACIHSTYICPALAFQLQNPCTRFCFQDPTGTRI